tara:strand:+ start:418 stop:696 length:279 start_codon:yes stop_codon:yes gene_type:complete
VLNNSAPLNNEGEKTMRSKLTYKEIENENRAGHQLTGAICFLSGLGFTWIAWKIGIPLINDLYELSAVALFGAIGMTIAMCGLGLIFKYRSK